MTTSLLWADFVSQNRKSQGMTRRRLAETAGIDPSYITLIEKNGVIPRRAKVIRLAEALNQDTDAALLLAGYAAERRSAETPAGKLKAEADQWADLPWIHPNLRLCINKLATLSDTDQISAAELLGVFMRTVDQREATLNSKGA